MTEQEYILERFGRYFKRFKGKKLFLYGQGVYTQAIIERFHGEYHFAAVLSDTDASGKFCDVPFLHIDALAGERPDMIILSEHKQTKEPDYERIHGICEEYNILLYDMYGIDELAVHHELASHVWQSLVGWRRITDGYDVVSFAVPDTFMEWDGSQDSIPEVREIFMRLAKMLTCRHVPVLFVGRNVLPGSVIAKALVEGGIINHLDEAETCLYMRHGEDLCFRTIRERFPGKKILHIGAGVANDGIIPRFYDIDTYRMVFLIPDVTPDKKIAPKGTSTISGEKVYNMAIEAIDRNQIVSFDVFDTLLLRKTLRPEDVFELTQRKALALGIQAEDFARCRKKAEQETYCGTLEDIYDTMRLYTDLPQQALEQLMALELETERSVISCRSPVAQLYRYALKQGKRVVLTSDMYMPEETLGALLKANGITQWEKLIVSCEYGCFKTEGLFQQLKALCAAKEGIVHIGDDLRADIFAAAEAGFETVHIPSALELARQSGWSAAIERAGTLAERCLVGLSVAGAFQNPFQVHSMKEMPASQRLNRYGYIAASVIVGYLIWMADKLAGSEYDGVLFPARDGWLLHEFYPRLAEAVKPEPLPAALYFYTSRHAAFLPVSARKKNQEYICTFKLKMRHKQFMQNVFNLEETDLLPPEDGEARIAYVRRHMNHLEKLAEEQKKCQLRYFKRCALKEGGRYVMSDFISQGTTQAFLKQFAPFDIYGLYFGKPAYTAIPREDIEYYFRSEDSVLLRNFMEMEGVMTSPEPSVTEFSEDGTPVFAKEVRTEERLSEMKLVQDVVRAYVNDYFDLFYCCGDVIRPVIPEEIYAADGYHWVFEGGFEDWVQAEWSY